MCISLRERVARILRELARPENTKRGHYCDTNIAFTESKKKNKHNTEMKKLNLIKRLWTDSHEKQSPQRFVRYAAMLIMLLSLGVGQIWG